MSTQHTPSAEDMRLAALWLEHNDDEGAEGETCHRVAAWLDAQAEAKEVREAAKKHGVPVGKLRAAIAKTAGGQS